MNQYYVELYEIVRAERILTKHGIVNALSKSAQKELGGAIDKIKKEKKQKKEKGDGLDKN